MEMCLTGRMMDAAEAERTGLVARVVPAADLVDEALKVAATIAAMSLARRHADQGERRARLRDQPGRGHPLRAARSSTPCSPPHDQKEGMAAFVEKRPPHFKNG